MMSKNSVSVTGIWLKGGKNSIEVLAEVDGKWLSVIEEFVPKNDNDGTVWPISHIVETAGILSGTKTTPDSST